MLNGHGSHVSLQNCSVLQRSGIGLDFKTNTPLSGAHFNSRGDCQAASATGNRNLNRTGGTRSIEIDFTFHPMPNSQEGMIA